MSMIINQNMRNTKQIEFILIPHLEDRKVVLVLKKEVNPPPKEEEIKPFVHRLISSVCGQLQGKNKELAKKSLC